MKSRFFNSVAILFVSVLLCLSFASCKNFLNAGAIRDEIQEAIEIANSSAVTMYITVDEDSGSVVPAQIVKKKKESFEIKFTPQPNWKFLNWEVIDRTTGEVVQDAVRFQDPEKPETKATILKPNSNYQIHAKCVLLPAIVSVSPANLQSAPVNSPIYITFNMQMEDSAIKPSESIFKYDIDNVSVFCGAKDMSDYFDAPTFFDSQKNMLVLTPKSELIRDYIVNERQTAYVDVTVFFGKNIVVQDGDIFLPLSEEGGKALTIRYSSQKEETPPKEYDFFVTHHKISLENASDLKNSPEKLFNYENLYQTSSDSEEVVKMLQNRTNGTIYIYGQYYDKDSGVRAITIKEKLVNSIAGGISVIADEITRIYLFGSSGAEFLRDSGGMTYFCIECQLQSGDGAVQVQVEVSDVAGNSAPKKSFVAVKKSMIDMDFTVSNGKSLDTMDFANPISEASYKNELKTITINEAGLFPDFYPIQGLSNDFIKDAYKVKILYDNEVQELNHGIDSLTSCWQTVLKTESINGLEFKVVVTDDIGNKAEKTYKIPDASSITYYKESDENTPSQELAYIISKIPDASIIGCHAIERNSDGTLNVGASHGGHSGSNIIFIEEGHTYQISPQIRDVGQTYSFYMDFTDNVNLVFGTSQAVVPPVQLKNFAASNSPVKIEKTDELYYSSPALKVSVCIADDSWANNKYDCILVSREFMGNTIFEDGKTVTSLLVRTEELFQSDINLTIYGYKNGKSSTGTPCKISKLTGKDLDNIKPYVLPYTKTIYDDNYNEIGSVTNLVRNSRETVLVSVMDDESGPARSEIKVKGIDDLFIADDYNSYTVELPLRNIEKNIWEDGSGVVQRSPYLLIDYWFYDQAGNCQYQKDCKIEIGYAASVKSFTVDPTSMTWTAIGEDKLRVIAFPENFDIYVFDNPYDDDYYTWSNKFTLQGNTVPDYNSRNKYNSSGSYSNDSTQDNYFVMPTKDRYIKIIAYYPYSIPSYIYTGEKSSSQADLILSHTNKSVLVQSSKPVFVHTLVTTAPYSECQNWSAEDWEYFNDCLGETVIEDAAQPCMLEYEIPVDYIDPDRRFAVVAHFASGKTAVSQVFSTPAE